MKIYTYSQARQNLAKILDEAKNEGELRIKRRDGITFTLKPFNQNTSPLDIEGIDSDLTAEELTQIVREGRERYS